MRIFVQKYASTFLAIKLRHRYYTSYITELAKKKTKEKQASLQSVKTKMLSKVTSKKGVTTAITSPSRNLRSRVSFSSDTHEDLLNTEERDLINSFKERKRKQKYKNVNTKKCRTSAVNDNACKDNLTGSSCNNEAVPSTSDYVNPAQSLNESGVMTEREDASVDTDEQARYIHIDFHDDYHGILFMKQTQKVALNGFVQVIVLCGEIEIFGYKIKATQIPTAFEVFSPTSSSLQYLRDTSTSQILFNARKNLEKSLTKLFDGHENEVAKIVNGCDEIFSCVLLKRISTLLPSLVKKLNDFQDFQQTPQILCNPFGKPVLDTSEWIDVIGAIQSEILNREHKCQCSIMLCGGKDVGKSTLSRYVINEMLNRHETVFYLDCDCGQTEFTPPAVLSLVKITKPLFGPPFTHQTKPVKSYFYGHISSNDTPEEYTQILELLFKSYLEEFADDGPLVINQQGWVRGLGLSLLIDCLRIMTPCYIIQINCTEFESRNLIEDLNEEYVKNQPGWSVNSSYKSLKDKSHECKYISLNTAPVQHGTNLGKHKSLTSRNLAITSYFSPLYAEHFVNKTDWIPPSMSLLLPYKIKWCDIAIHVMHQNISPDVMLYAFNMAVVCLAKVNTDIIVVKDEDSMDHPSMLQGTPKAEFLGLAVVRNIDPKNKLFYILTPEPIEVLQNVNALLKGNVQLPKSYFLQDMKSNDPYYCHDYISVKGAGGMKPRFNLKRRPSKLKNSFGDRTEK